MRKIVALVPPPWRQRIRGRWVVDVSFMLGYPVTPDGGFWGGSYLTAMIAPSRPEKLGDLGVLVSRLILKLRDREKRLCCRVPWCNIRLIAGRCCAVQAGSSFPDCYYTGNGNSVRRSAGINIVRNISYDHIPDRLTAVCSPKHHRSNKKAWM